MSKLEAIDSALLEVLKRSAAGYYEAEVIVSGADLPAELADHLTDKFEIESTIASVTFK